MVNESINQINGYLINRMIAQTQGSCLFLANKVSKDGKKDTLSFLLKRYDQKMPRDILENEKAVSHYVKEHCSKNIAIPILETIEGEDGYTYAVMQYEKQGLFLSEIMEKLQIRYGEGQIPINIVVEIIDRILDSLNVLHSFPAQNNRMGNQIDVDIKGFLHLDLHPGNIFFENADMATQNWGTVKFIDFATAVPVNQIEKLYKRAWRSFTFGYSAPEMGLLAEGQIMEATDLYSLGMIMKELLSEKKVFTGKEPTLIAPAKDSYRYSDSSKVITSYTGCEAASFMVDQFLSIVLQENPVYRYASTAQMKDALNNIIDTIAAFEKGDLFHYYQKSYRRVVPESQLREESVKMSNQSFSLAQRLLEANIRSDFSFTAENRYIFDLLWDKGLGEEEVKVRSKIQMAYSGINIYNNMGMPVKVAQLFQYIMDNNSQLTPDEYIAVRSRMHVKFADVGDYKKAYEIAESNVKMINAFYQIITEESGTKIFYSADRARNYSAMGTYRSMQGLIDQETLECYERSLKEFLADDTFNRKMTMSKILHLAIMKEDSALYEKYRSEYFASSDFNITSIMQELLDEGRYRNFDIYLMLKLIYCFHLDQVKRPDIQNLICKMAKLPGLLNDKTHTRILISRYLALLIYEINDKTVNREVNRLFRDSMKALPLGRRRGYQEMNPILTMSLQSEWIYNDLLGENEANTLLLSYTQSLCEKSGWNSMVDQIKREKSLKYLYKHEYS